MNLSWIDDFMALAATGNFSRAAEERHMTQPAFSRRIRALEEWLGADLFDRSSQPARVTEVGEWFRTVAQDLQSRVAGIPGQARAIAEASSTTLRFAATHALSFTFMPRWLHALEAHASMGQLQLMSDVQQKCETLLSQNQVHFMLAHGHPGVHGPLDEADFPSLVVGTDQLIPVSAPDNSGRPLHGLPSSGKATQMQWLGYSPESGLGRILKQLKGPALDRMHAHQVLTAHLASVLRTMALDQRGLAWLPKLLIEDDMATGRLVVAARDDWRIDLQIRLYRRRGDAGKAAEAFWKAASTASEPPDVAVL
ncbi:LysR substrate-binding domain-containing protein [Schlegelella sp. S2-27]|uniref:LysR substrate-binding domain-containing protein n=2 Tax=Caldimonas mangrovi TaxID=2944811 RepID=A0ABT0YRG3_9BURK|nr:LysR substrate-binding domain-containing protein [Caldimonas mangrovi]MCM5680433.1 LysR substrate-binding domain-containing protein [Caldimonas mangrovi]